MPVAVAADKRFRRAHVRPAHRRRSWVARALAVLRNIAALGILIGGGYLLTQQVAQARVLHVDRIVVHGNERLSTGEVHVLLEGLRGQHVLAIDLDVWKHRLLASPWVEHASVRRVLPSTVDVTIRERQPMAIGRHDGKLYLVDASGYVIDEFGPNYAQFDLPIIDGLVGGRGEDVDDAAAALAGRAIASLGRHPALFRRISQLDVSDSRDAVVVLESDTVFVHLGDDQFAERLQGYVDLAPTLKQQVPEIEHADMRIASRVYVRPTAGKGRRDAKERRGAERR